VSGEQKEDGCVFCNRLQCDDRAQYVLHRGERWYLILNLYPYNSGHLLLVLGRHASRIADCTPDELVDLARYLKLMEDVLQEAFRPDGINCGYNGGTSAGAGIPGHLHVHMLPRWAGDTNFMSTVGQTRVMPQTLDQVWERLKPVVDRLSPGFGATAARPEGS
jgi:ATP adenylyltransferase